MQKASFCHCASRARHYVVLECRLINSQVGEAYKEIFRNLSCRILEEGAPSNREVVGVHQLDSVLKGCVEGEF